MRLSTVFELLLVFLFLAFAAARVIDPAKGVKNVAKENKKTTTLRQGPPNRYCACTSRMCNCCRDFSLPVVPLKGPGCASIMYVQRDTMMVTMSFGDRVLSNTTISGKTPRPICMTLPGGISQFCGRIYGISRKGDQFRACLGLELRALDDIEAALRVSCFKFGPKGVKLESAPPVPAETNNKKPEEDDEDDYDLDDDDDDLIGFGVDDEDDGGSNEDNEIDSDSVDYTGFSVLGEDILGTFFSDDSGSSSAKKKKPSKKTAKPQVLVPQVVVPKVSTTTRRPILPNRRRSTVRPLLSATKRPLLNRVTKRPTISTSRPQLLQRPSAPVIASPQFTLQSTSLPVSSSTVTKHEVNKNIVTKSSSTTTEVPMTTMRVVTTENSQSSEKLQTLTEEVSQETIASTEEPITFIVPTQKIEAVKNDIRLPQTDLAKVEAVAAIAQQDVTSGVISTSSFTSEKTEAPEETVTITYEKISQSTPSFSSENMEKVSSVKFIPTTVLTTKPSPAKPDRENLFHEIKQSETATNSDFELTGVKNKVTVYQQGTASTVSNEKIKDNISKYEEILDKNTIEKNSQTKKGNITISVKKQPVKKPVKEEEEEDEEEEEGEEDILEGVLSDDDSDNEEGEENDGSSSQTSLNKIKDEVNDSEKEEEIDDEDDFLGETIETTQKVKPSKISNKKKPASDDSANEEEEEEDEDILDVLGDGDDDDDDNEEEEEEESDEEDDENEKEKNKKKPTTPLTPTTITVKIKKPVTQATVQTKKPVTITEKLPASTTVEENFTEKVTEKIFIYKQPPVEKVPQNIFIYKEPENKIPEKIFIYKDPGNQIIQKPTEKIIFYKEPVQQNIPEHFVIFKEPDEKFTEKPAVILKEDSESSEETKNDSEEEDKVESDDENSSEEEFEDENSEKHTLMASIVKPGFSNKYAAEHDLTENDDLDIEDTEDDDNDFEEDRKMKEGHKKSVAKSPNIKKSNVNNPKILSLSDLIGQKKYDHLKDDKPISTSRTHRRMNLDRLLQI